jgi:2-keto-4-pentenoate hydratase/2-oxohepta-3-ene-1,7-dioic acid hydratase in catechol pathway
MKLCRFDDDRVGVVRGDTIRDVTAAAERAMAPYAQDRRVDPLIAGLPALRAELAAGLEGSASRPLAGARLLAPVRWPGKIVAAPVNYRAHIAEMQASNVSPGHGITDIAKAGLFLKASSSLVGAAEGVAVRFPERRTDYEVELVAVIGTTAGEVAPEAGLACVAGYCLGLDVTVRGSEDRSFRKSIDSYTVLGPWLTTADEVPNPNALRLTLHQNGALRQDGATTDLVYSVERLIAFASAFYTLHPGDLLFTGTPEGVGPIRPGDRLRAYCEPLGPLDVDVRAHAPARLRSG